MAQVPMNIQAMNKYTNSYWSNVQNETEVEKNGEWIAQMENVEKMSKKIMFNLINLIIVISGAIVFQ